MFEEIDYGATDGQDDPNMDVYQNGYIDELNNVMSAFD